MDSTRQDRLHTLLRTMPEDTLARWYVCLNQWEWPGDIPLLPPAAWCQTSTDTERMGAAHEVWDYLKAHTTERARSRAWWLYALGRSEAAWEAYWALPVCPTCCLRHKDGTVHP